MIKVIKENNVITISGHANNDVYGKDIVCASVSSIIYTTINDIEVVRKSSISVEDNKSMIIEILTDDEVVNKLINNMMNLLKDLQKDYPKNILVKES